MSTTGYGLPPRADLNDIVRFLAYITAIRYEEDIPDYIGLNSRFLTGRRTERIPSAANDVLDTDSVGDFTNDTTYTYLLVDIGGGTLLWNRLAMDTGW